MFYKIVDKALIEKVKAICAKRHEAQEAFLRLSRKVGASRTQYAVGDACGTRSFAFIFS